jgi:hypothetical protein
MSRLFYQGYQTKLRDLLLAETPLLADFSPLGGDPARWQAYRRMVRSRFYQVTAHGFERLIGVIGMERFHAMVDRFLDEAPPRSPYLRDVPGELVAFVESAWDRIHAAFALPAYALDLMRYEWAELDAGYSHEEVRPSDVVPLVMDQRAVLSPAHRLLQLDFAVHRCPWETPEGVLGTDGDDGLVAPGPISLCLYRDPKTHDVETLELTPVAFAILSGIEREHASLTDVVRNASREQNVEVDVAFVEALSALLADLIERGVLLGSLADQLPVGSSR